ncbi:MAG: ferredoxin [Candidatus Tectimicrobiota bacterium]
MPKRDRYVFICLNERPPGHPRGSCRERGAVPVLEQFAELLEGKDLLGAVRVIGTTCLDTCESGVTLAVYPDDVWYGRVAVGDVEEIVARHFQSGQPVERLTLGPDDFE